MGSALASQRENPYATIPRVQTYMWIEQSMKRLYAAQLQNPLALHSSPLQNHGLETLVVDNTAEQQRQGVYITTTLNALEQQRAELAKEPEVIHYHQFEVEQRTLGKHTLWGLSLALFGLFYGATFSNPKL